MRATIKRIALLGLGWGFIVLGIIGLFLPFLQGVLFILIGLVILSHNSPRVRLLLRRLRARYPRLSAGIDAAEARLRSIGRRRAR
jgi:uncharacterized protein